MGLAWQQGPFAPGAIGRFLGPDPLPDRLLYAEPLRRRMRVRFGGAWIADSEAVTLLHEPGRYPVAYFPAGDIADGVLEPGGHTTRHQDLGTTSWYTARLRPEPGQTVIPHGPDRDLTTDQVGRQQATMTGAAARATGPVTERHPPTLWHTTVRAGGWVECCRGDS